MSAAVMPIIAEAARRNIVTVHLLALCPMLAVSTSVKASLTLGLLTTAVMTLVGAAVAFLRHKVSESVRLPILLILVALAVAVLDLLMAAYAPALHRQLGIFLPLIITNCAVLARLEVFARHQPPFAAALDGAANGIAMSAVLLILAVVRELMGTGTISGLLTVSFFDGIALAQLPAGGFILFGLLLAFINILRRIAV